MANRSAPVIDPIRDAIHSLLEQNLTAWKIWTRVVDERNADASYSTVHDYIRNAPPAEFDETTSRKPRIRPESTKPIIRLTQTGPRRSETPPRQCESSAAWSDSSACRSAASSNSPPTGSTRANGDAYLTLGQHPVLLPPKLAALIEEHRAHPCYRSMVRPRAGEPPRYLLPASQPGKPRSARTTQKLLRQHGLPTLAARNTAMIEAVGELPPIVIADLFGIHPGTAHAWAKFAQVNWTDYLAARQADE